MPYFGSSIEGAAGTALQAANSIADRENANRWQAYNAMAQQQAQQAQMEQARFANEQALRQAAEANYFRNAQMRTDQLNRAASERLAREQMGQSQRQFDQNYFLRKAEQDFMKDQMAKQAADEAQFTKNYGESFRGDLGEIDKSMTALSQALTEKTADMQKLVNTAMQWVAGQYNYNGVSGVLEPIRGVTPSATAAKFVADYNAAIRAKQDEISQIQNQLRSLGTERRQMRMFAAKSGIPLSGDYFTGATTTPTSPAKQPQIMDLINERQQQEMSQNQLREQSGIRTPVTVTEPPQFEPNPVNYFGTRDAQTEAMRATPSWNPYMQRRSVQPAVSSPAVQVAPRATAAQPIHYPRGAWSKVKDTLIIGQQYIHPTQGLLTWDGEKFIQ